MQLDLARNPTLHGATTGRLFVDGEFQCFTLEDAVREIPGQPVEAWKIPNNTAIPAGVYTVTLDWSDRFRALMPHLAHVPGFTSIRMHTGNTTADTEGCILVGANLHGILLTDSWAAFKPLMSKLCAALIAGMGVSLRIHPAAESAPQ